MRLKSISIFLLAFWCFRIQANIPIVNLGQADRYEIKVHEIKMFRIKKNGYDPNQRYELRVSYLGSLGAEITMRWRNTKDLEAFSAYSPSFRPLDTQNLNMYANKDGILEGPPDDCLSIIDGEEYFIFFMFMYRNSPGRNRYYNEKPMELYITLIPVLFPGVGINIIEAHAAPLIAAFVIFMCILPLTIKKIPHFKEFLKRDYDPDKRLE